MNRQPEIETVDELINAVGLKVTAAQKRALQCAKGMSPAPRPPAELAMILTKAAEFRRANGMETTIGDLLMPDDDGDPATAQPLKKKLEIACVRAPHDGRCCLILRWPPYIGVECEWQFQGERPRYRLIAGAGRRPSKPADSRSRDDPMGRLLDFGCFAERRQSPMAGL